MSTEDDKLIKAENHLIDIWAIMWLKKSFLYGRKLYFPN